MKCASVALSAASPCIFARCHSCKHTTTAPHSRSYCYMAGVVEVVFSMHVHGNWQSCDLHPMPRDSIDLMMALIFGFIPR